MKKIKNLLPAYGIPIILALGVSIVLFIHMAGINSTPKSETYRTFYSLTNGLDGYTNLKTAWQPRIFSTFLAAFISRVSAWVVNKISIPVINSPAELTIALWTTGWFLASGFVSLVTFKQRSIFYFFGTFAAISFGYLPRLEMAVRVYPWDLPALFFFTLFMVFWLQKKYWLAFILIPLGVGFKETALILSIAFLFADLQWKQRLRLFLGSILLGFAIKISIDYFLQLPLFFTMETRVGGNQDASFYLFSNLYWLKRIMPFFVNAGTLLALILLPITNKNILVFKIIAAFFILGNFLFGNIIEYRIWFELTPFALYALDINMYHAPQNNNDLEKSIRA